MTTLRFLAGLLAIVVLVVPPAFAAWRVQRVLPRRNPTLHVLAGCIVTIAIVLVTAMLLGTVGGFRLAPLLVGNLCSSALVVVALRRWGPDTASEPPRDAELDAAPESTAPALPGWLLAGIALVVAGVSVRWISTTLETLAGGIFDPDSVQYHLPFAAEFAKTGWLTRFHSLFPDPIQMFYPANSEVLQSIGMVSMGRDVLAPLANIGWFAILLLSGWCAGLRDRVAPLTLLVVTWFAGIPLLAYTNSGTALTDVSMLACLLAAVALWRAAHDDTGWTAMAGLALGLAVGMKFTVLPTAGVLAMAMVFVAPRDRRRRLFVVVAVTAAAGCAFWFLRNLFRTGSPLPSVSLPFLHRTELPLVDKLGLSVSHYLFDGEIWRHTYWPGIRYFFGWSGLVAVVAAIVGVAAVVRARRDIRILALIVVGAIAAISYLFVPAGAWGPEGEPNFVLFTVNIRYVLPAMIVLGTAMALAMAGASARLRAVFGGALLFATLIEVVHYPARWTPYTKHTVLAAVLLVFALVAVGVARVVALPRSGRGRAAVGAVATVVLLVVGVLGAHGARNQLEHRAAHYAGSPMWRYLATVEPGSRIGYFGLSDDYVLYGPHWKNDVEYLGVPGPRGAFRVPENCREYVGILQRLDPDFVLLGDDSLYTLLKLDLPAWTTPQPGAQLIVVDAPYSLFSVHGPYDPSLCPAGT